ncbi:DUF4157 domain-containing protein [Draconibacterium sp.]|nr:DUF4157 domain-containing protein [Draconibacterium sp.]
MFATKETGKREMASRAIANTIRAKANSNMAFRGIQTKLTIGQPNDKYEQEADRVADRVMSMPEPTQIQRTCSSCQGEEVQTKPLFPTITPLVQRQLEDEEELAQTKPLIQQQPEEEEEEESIMTKSNDNNSQTATSAIETGIIQSTGHGAPLPDSTRAFMENRFGTDFSGVRVHIDSNSTQLNRQLNSQAFTKGSDIYFNSGKYNPESSSGKHLLAHELTHVVQHDSRSNGIIRRITCPVASDVARQPPGRPNRLDARARRIITAAQNSSVAIRTRALQVVRDIVCMYMPSQANKIRRINYNAGETGLGTQSVGRGATARGDITVGDYFVRQTTNRHISRRILQVAHEIEHINQYRSGMTGGRRQDEREFLAFHQEATADEFTGTGRMQYSTRLSLVDGALGYFYCLSSGLQRRYNSQKMQLLRRRQTLVASGRIRRSGPVPTGCRRS